MFYESLFKGINLKKGKSVDINLAGVVGVGKSSLSEYLQVEGFTVFKEPVFDNPLLDKFYYNKQRYSFPLQIFFLNKRFELIKKASHIKNTVLDRSILEDTIFAKMLYDSGDMEKEEFYIYMELFKNMLNHVKPPELMVYLRVSPEEAIRRINKRGRDFEVKNSTEYWYNLSENYESYFKNYSWSPLLTIDVDDIDFVKSTDDRKYIIDKILNFNKNKLANNHVRIR
jgi:deoxyadenosine/deoxycytidine kinase